MATPYKIEELDVTALKKDQTSGEEHQAVVKVVDQANQKQSWVGKYLWDTADLSREERRLLTKVDASLLLFASLGYFIKNLDQTNVNTAFVSGMKEDLSMYGNELVTSVTLWTVGYVIGQVPSNLLLTRIPPHYVIPALEFSWGLATLGTYAIKNYKTLYALRFLVGLFESGFYPGMHYILSSWYTPRELNKRSTIFWVAGSLGNMFSGILQTAAHRNLNGVHGLEGWRWMFIIDAIITLPIAILGFWFLPDSPWDSKPSFLLSQADIDLARARMKAIGRAEAEPWSRAKLKRIFSSWVVWVMPLTYVIWNNSYLQNPMSFWLKSFNATAKKPAPVPGTSYSVSQINLLPLPTIAVFVVVALIQAWMSDGLFKGRRSPGVIIGAFINIAVAGALLKLPVYGHDKAHFALYYLLNAGSAAGPAILNWGAELAGGDVEMRALVIALGNDLAYVVQGEPLPQIPIAPNWLWKTTDMPAARKGMAWGLGLSVLLIFWVLFAVFLERREAKNATVKPDAEVGPGSAATSVASEKELDDASDSVKV